MLAGDPAGGRTHVVDALSSLADAPCPGLAADARRFGAEAARSTWAGDVERAHDPIRVLVHVVADMQSLEASDLFAAA